MCVQAEKKDQQTESRIKEAVRLYRENVTRLVGDSSDRFKAIEKLEKDVKQCEGDKLEACKRHEERHARAS